MKKIVLLLTAVMFTGLNANVANALIEDNKAMEGNAVVNIDTVEKKNPEENVKKEITADDVAEVLSMDVDADIDAENWGIEKYKLLTILEDTNKKIEEAKKDNKPVAELNAQQAKLLNKLDEINNKILKENYDEEMSAARAKNSKSAMDLNSQQVFYANQHNKLISEVQALDKEIAVATRGQKDVSDLLEKKKELLNKCDEVATKLKSIEAEALKEK